MAAKSEGKYDFLLALKPGEEWVFENKPTLSESRRKVSPSNRASYKMVTMGVHNLRRSHGVSLVLTLSESRGSRIPGNQIVVRMLDAAGDAGDIEKLEERRQRATDAWRKRKQAEEAPLLPEQLAQEECVAMAKRTAGAVRAQAQAQALRAEGPKYDPKQIAVLVTAQLRGETIQQSMLVNNVAGVEREWRDQPNPTWTEPTAFYRIKPAAPREWYMVVGRDGKVSAVNTTIAGLPHHDPSCRVRVLEVMPDE